MESNRIYRTNRAKAIFKFDLFRSTVIENSYQDWFFIGQFCCAHKNRSTAAPGMFLVSSSWMGPTKFGGELIFGFGGQPDDREDVATQQAASVGRTDAALNLAAIQLFTLNSYTDFCFSASTKTFKHERQQNNLCYGILNRLTNK